MEENPETPPVQVPTEANDYKHIDRETDTDKEKANKNNSSEDKSQRNNTGGSNLEPVQEISENENDIDPGNEHHHTEDINNNIALHNPYEGKNDAPPTSGEAG